MAERSFAGAMVLFLVSMVFVGASAPSAAEPVRDGTDHEAEHTENFVIGFDELPDHMESGSSYRNATVIDVHEAINAATVDPHPRFDEGRTEAQSEVRYVERQFIYNTNGLGDSELLSEREDEDSNPERGQETSDVEASFTPNDPLYSDQYGPQQIRADSAWDTTQGDSDASVCVVDTGVRYTHDDLQAQWEGGVDIVNSDNDPWDDSASGHGTHVAGIAAASIDNNEGIAGVAEVELYGVKVLDSSGSGTNSDVADGITWCADNTGSQTVINLSLGSPNFSQAISDAIQHAIDQDVLVVAAAGNSGPCSSCVDYPARDSGAIAVTCTESNEEQCWFSSEGGHAEIAGPGKAILSTCNGHDNHYCTLSGTSMSAPHVAGAAALVWSHQTSFSWQQLRQQLQRTAQDVGLPGWDGQYGHGEVDARCLLDGSDPCLVDSPRKTFSAVSGDNFDDGAADNWMLSGLWHVSDACASPPSTPNYLGYNKDSTCSYDTGDQRNGGTALFSLDLETVSSASMEFQHRWETESFSSPFDIMRVQVSTDKGASWITLEQWDSSDSNQGSWGAESIDLSPYTGQVVQVRFLFTTLDSVGNDFEGWFLDDVGVSPPTLPVDFLETFDDGTADHWSLTGLWHVSDACENPPSSPNYLGYHQQSTCSYDTGEANRGVAAFGVDLSGVPSAILSFDHRWETESFSSPFDVMQVEASADNGASWDLLAQWDSRDSNQLSWSGEQIDLTSYSGDLVHVRFELDTIDSVGNDFEGWFLDNVEVEENQPPDACFTYSPQNGDLDTQYQFDAGCTTDDFTPPFGFLEYRWDFDGDGTWDTGWRTSETASHQYDSPGDKTVVLQARDGHGLTDTTSRTLTVHILCAGSTCVG